MKQSAFLIAAQLGYTSLAKSLVLISIAQYRASDGDQPPTTAYSIERAKRDICHPLTDQIYSSDCIEKLSALVASPANPIEMVLEANLPSLALKASDPKLAKFAIEMRSLFPPDQKDLLAQNSNFSNLLSRGWEDALEELIKVAGVPFMHLIKDGRIHLRSHVKLSGEHSTSPLLQAAHGRSLMIIEFFCSERPMAAYQWFVTKCPYIARESPETNGQKFLQYVENWLNKHRMCASAYHENFDIHTS
jgi:hypothetical protein